MLLGLLSAAAPAAAAEPTRMPATAESVRAFLDERVPALLGRFDTPGAAVAVVDRDATLHQQGYGEADIASGRPVSADGTAFATASVAKSFTAMALLQLVDAGRVDLHADVNDYLPDDVRVPDTYPGRPVTPHHLLTHTAGFEEDLAGLAVDRPDRLLPLREYVRRHQPERVEPPGRFTAYSNYSLDMVGLIVEEVSGREFGARVAEHVFAPLGMDRTTFAHPAEARRRLDVPTSYFHGDAGSTPATDLLLHPLPSGGAYATVRDMARFLRAMLRGGELDGQRVLSEAGAAAMLQWHEGNDGRLTGAGYGTWQRALDPVAFGHSGDLPGTHTEYAVLPELGLGIYVATNGDGSDADPIHDMREALVAEFLERFGGLRPAMAAAVTDPGDYAGTYLSTRVSQTDVSALRSALDQVKVRKAADGTLQTTSPIRPSRTWTPLGDGMYQEPGGDRLAFVVEDDEVIGLATDSDPTLAYKRVPWYADPQVHLLVAAGGLVVLATTLTWPLVALVRRLRGRPRTAPPSARLVAAAAALLCLGFAAFLGYAVGQVDFLEGLIFTGSPLLQVPLGVAALLTAAVLVATIAAWRKGWWSVLGRLHYTTVAAAAVAVVTVGAHYNMAWPL